MNGAVAFWIAVRSLALPNNLVTTALDAKHFIQDNFRIRANVPIQVNINATVIGKQFAEQKCGFVHPL